MPSSPLWPFDVFDALQFSMCTTSDRLGAVAYAGIMAVFGILAPTLYIHRYGFFDGESSSECCYTFLCIFTVRTNTALSSSEI